MVFFLSIVVHIICDSYNQRDAIYEKTWKKPESDPVIVIILIGPLQDYLPYASRSPNDPCKLNTEFTGKIRIQTIFIRFFRPKKLIFQMWCKPYQHWFEFSWLIDKSIERIWKWWWWWYDKTTNITYGIVQLMS